MGYRTIEGNTPPKRLKKRILEEYIMKRPSLSRDGKTTPWWVLLHEFEVYVLFLEKLLKENKIPLPKP